jgi:hypothetical protein
MTVNNDKEINQVEKPSEDPAEPQQDNSSSGEGEFKLTVRKLEMPVRPRGVLAE